MEMKMTRGDDVSDQGMPDNNDTSKLAEPTPKQLAWQELEVGMFIHYDINVFQPGWDHRQYATRPEASIFDPRKLNTDQWMEAAKSMGATYALFTAKHGSGFMCWQSDLYPYGMKQSPYKGGRGDIVQDFVDSCRKYGIEPGSFPSRLRARSIMSC